MKNNSLHATTAPIATHLEPFMSRLNTPATIDAAPAATHASLKTVEKQLGGVPNMFRVVANSPAALSGYLQLSAASAQGGLDAATRERIALAVAELNGCGYCLSAHSFLGRKVAKLSRTFSDSATAAAFRRMRLGILWVPCSPVGPCALPPPWCANAGASATTRSTRC